MRDVRDRQYELAGDLGRSGDLRLDPGSAELLVTFAEDLYPEDPGAVYACHPVAIDAADAEGATATYSADASVTIYALNIGTAVPDPGTYVIAVGVGGRMVFRHDG